MTTKPIVLVTGGRKYDAAMAVDRTLSALDPGLLIEGGAKADEKYMSRVAHLAPPPDLPARLDFRE